MAAPVRLSPPSRLRSRLGPPLIKRLRSRLRPAGPPLPRWALLPTWLLLGALVVLYVVGVVVLAAAAVVVATARLLLQPVAALLVRGGRLLAPGLRPGPRS